MSIKYSVIVLTYNQLESATVPCAESLLKHSPMKETELLFVDNASTDGTQQYLKNLQRTVKGVNVVLNTQNVGFSAGNNDGLKRARGEYVVILNNDTLVTPNWLPKITRSLDKDPKVGLVGPVTNYAGTEQRISLRSINEGNYVDVSEQYTNKQTRHTFPTKRLSFFCVAMRRQVLDQVGLLDEQFARGMFEDDDYCARVLAAKFKVVVAEDCFIYHKGSVSFNAIKRKEYAALFDKNKWLFERKYHRPYLFSDEGLAYIEKFNHDLLDWRKTGDVGAVERVYVRLQIVEDYQRFLRDKEREASLQLAVLSVKNQVSQDSSVSKKEDAILMERVAQKRLQIERMHMRLTSSLNDPIFATWQKLRLIVNKFYDAVSRLSLVGRVDPYLQLSFLKPITVEVIARHFPDNRNRKVTVIITVKNEARTMTRLLDSLAEQTVIPNEVIVVDGGSKDDTVKLIRSSALRRKTNLTVLQGNYNISEGRNAGIARAKNEIIVTTDAGCILNSRCIQDLTAPLFVDRSVDLVGGTYESWHSTNNRYFVPNWETNDWQRFLPSARIAAYKKSIIDQIGGFPEYLNTGEDTLFGIRYRAVSKKWVFNQVASVLWNNPSNFAEYNLLAYRYGLGDGQSGVGDWSFYLATMSSFRFQSLIEREHDMFFRGYIDGKQQRSRLEKERIGLRGVALIFADTILPAQNPGLYRLLRKATRQNLKSIVIFSKNRSPEQKMYVSPIEFPSVEFIYIQDFRVEDMVDRYLEQFSTIWVSDIAKTKKRLVRSKSKRLEAFFTVQRFDRKERT